MCVDSDKMDMGELDEVITSVSGGLCPPLFNEIITTEFHVAEFAFQAVYQ